MPLTDLFTIIDEISAEQGQHLVTALADNRWDTAAFAGPVYDDARKVLTRQAAALVHAEGLTREFYVARWMRRKPELDWDVDFFSGVHSVMDSPVDSIIESIFDSTAQSVADSNVDKPQGGWLVVLLPERRGDGASTYTHLPHWVVASETSATCTNCHFATMYLLPCRHIQAVNLRWYQGRAFQPGQCHPRWMHCSAHY